VATSGTTSVKVGQWLKTVSTPAAHSLQTQLARSARVPARPQTRGRAGR